MGITDSLLGTKWSQIFKITVIVLCLTALTAEFLPEVKAKIIVVPALAVAVFTCLVELKRERSHSP